MTYGRCLGLFLLAACAAAPGRQTEAAAFSFDDVPLRALPAGFRVDATRRIGPLASWEVAAVPNAPSGGQVLSLVYPNHKSYDSFNLCWNPDLVLGNGAVQVQLCARSGKEDQGGGLIWRAQGPDDYYVARVNPLENNLRLYHVVGGNREMLASADCAVKVGQWCMLRIEHRGDRIQCGIDGRVLIDVTDSTLPAAGGVGLWTKADAATDFDELRITP